MTTITKMMNVRTIVNQFLQENYHNAVLDFLEGSSFPEMLDAIEGDITASHSFTSVEQEQLHELLHSPEFEEAFKAGWSEDIEEDFENYYGSAEEFVADLEWSGL